MDESEEKRSYSLSDWQRFYHSFDYFHNKDLHRLRTVCRALRQTEENVARLKSEIETHLSAGERSRDRV